MSKTKGVVIDKAAAVRIATSSGWEPPQHALMAEHWKAEYDKLKAKQWVGLSEDDKKEYVAQDFGGNRLDAMDWAEKRLKEKNT